MRNKLLLCVLALFAAMALSSGQSVKNPSHNRGIAGNVESGVFFKDGFAGEYVNVSSGYNVLPGLYAGVGIGIKDQRFNDPSNFKSVFVPTFIQLRYSVLNRVVSPFIDLKGGLISDYSGSVKSVPDGFSGYGCGHFFSASIGVDYKRYSVYVGDDWSQINYSGASHNGYAWVLGVGFKF